ncbi:hypothetical protein D3I93_02230 [Serratia marcescens]|uniref:hypothetical protein n=1 Tax=Serratia marcescens TaxID=615 RepID=UPI000E76E474|nr:hypothetical protein [Serratia marcescens]RJY02615.1 hypothetical protein D3I93_02230 [Serratia marcescens]
MIWHIIATVYLVGFFITFYITTRQGDEFGEVVFFSITWPILFSLLPVVALFEGFHKLYEKIKGDA